MSEPAMQEQIKKYVMEHASDIEVSTEIRKRMAHHQKVLIYHLKQYGIETDKLQPLAVYADYVLSSTNTKLISELIDGIQTKFVLRNGAIANA